MYVLVVSCYRHELPFRMQIPTKTLDSEHLITLIQLYQLKSDSYALHIHFVDAHVVMTFDA